jgi:hypothetical protein
MSGRCLAEVITVAAAQARNKRKLPHWSASVHYIAHLDNGASRLERGKETVKRRFTMQGNFHVDCWTWGMGLFGHALFC